MLLRHWVVLIKENLGTFGKFGVLVLTEQDNFNCGGGVIVTDDHQLKKRSILQPLVDPMLYFHDQTDIIIDLLMFWRSRCSNGAASIIC